MEQLEALLAQQQYKEIMERCAERLQEDNVDALSFYFCGASNDAQGLELEAIPYYERAIESGLPPHYEQKAYVRLGSCYRSIGNYEEAHHVFSKGIESFPDHRGLQLFHAMNLYNSGRSKDAVLLLLRTSLESMVEDQWLKRYRGPLTYYSERIEEVCQPESSIRAARIEEAVDLSTLALQSKGYWGYDEAFMAECRSVLTLTEEYVGKNPTYLYERNGKPIAFYSMVLDKGELDYFYVHPDYIGSGIGQKMWQHVLETARTYALSALIIQSDPHAHPFYTKMGAVTIGQIDSEVDTSRKLPLLQVTIQ